MQRHIRLLELGKEKVKMIIEAPERFNLSKVHITFTSPDEADQKKFTKDWREALIEREFPKKKKPKKQIGFAAISAIR